PRHCRCQKAPSGHRATDRPDRWGHDGNCKQRLQPGCEKLPDRRDGITRDHPLLTLGEFFAKGELALPFAIRLGIVLVASLLVASASRAAGPPSAASPRGKPAELYERMKVWTMHLTVQPKDWETMQPARGGFSRAPAKGAKLPAITDERK